MDADDVSKNTNPNSIRDATDARLDELYNYAHGHLRGTDEGLLRQTEASIRAILDEVSRRRGKKAWTLSIMSFSVALVMAALAVTNYLTARTSGSRIRELETRILELERTKRLPPAILSSPNPSTTSDAPDATRPPKVDTQ